MVSPYVMMKKLFAPVKPCRELFSMPLDLLQYECGVEGFSFTHIKIMSVCKFREDLIETNCCQWIEPAIGGEIIFCIINSCLHFYCLSFLHRKVLLLKINTQPSEETDP